ncbi:hypothetical protein SAMN05216389_11273 [Oceanobacillus limi]|uniref:Uncharacterized protein n=1 Tax=Oceanobacillus limi TaxID=930131 RepID=A0A1I0ESY2_9BACI|nr:hypothetical protein SAMN05216389_11273 [Oceanobacillus limi]
MWQKEKLALEWVLPMWKAKVQQIRKQENLKKIRQERRKSVRRKVGSGGKRRDGSHASFLLAIESVGWKRKNRPSASS